MENQDQPQKKIYTKEEIKKIAPSYRGKPANFNPNHQGGKKPPTKPHGPATPNIPAPTSLGTKPTAQKNTPIWADSIFGIDVSVRELNVNQEITPSFARLPEIVDEVYASIGGDDTSLNKQLSKGMLSYYSTAMLWARLLDIKAKRGDTALAYEEQEFLKSIMGHEYNIPQPIYLFLKGVGEVKDATGKTLHLANHALPRTVVNGFGGYHSQTIDAESHNLYEEIPSLGICGDYMMAEASEVAQPVPNFRVTPPRTRPTSSLVGNHGIIGPRKEELRILLTSMGVDATHFRETVNGTRLNIQIVQRVSDYLVGCKTFRNEKVKLDALTIEGDAAQLIKSIPTAENVNAAEKWTNLIVRPTSANASSTTTFGATYLTGYQLSKNAVAGTHANWCCLEQAAAANAWEIPAEWIENRNARRALPPGMDVERFVSISDSQRNRTNAIVRRMIVSLR